MVVLGSLPFNFFVFLMFILSQQQLENFDRQSMPISSPTNDEIFDVASFSPSFSGSDCYSSDTTTVPGSSALSVTSAAALVKDFLLDIPKVLDYELVSFYIMCA